MIEKPGSLFNPWFGASLVVVLAGAVLASQGYLRSAAVALTSGVVVMLVVVARSQTR